MEMRKFLHSLLCAVALGSMLSLGACSKDDDKPEVPNPDAPTVSQGAYVLNQGNYYNQVEGSLSVINYDSKKSIRNAFLAANDRTLGAMPQCGVAYGSKVYLGMSESSTIEICDAATLKSLVQIKCDGKDWPGQQPYSMVATGGKVYVCMYNGYVQRIDTVTNAVDATVQVGPNPDTMALFKGKLYVPNSDGMNWQSGYGTTASVVDLASFTVTKTLDTGLNPSMFCATDNNLYLLCKGNYGDVASTLYKYENDRFVRLADATMVATGHDRVYIVNSPFVVDGVKVEYSQYNEASGKVEPWNVTGTDYPSGMAVDPVTGNILISSYVMDGPYPSYTAPGYLNVYAPSMSLLNKYSIGAGPAAIFFSLK